MCSKLTDRCLSFSSDDDERRGRFGRSPVDPNSAAWVRFFSDDFAGGTKTWSAFFFEPLSLPSSVANEDILSTNQKQNKTIGHVVVVVVMIQTNAAEESSCFVCGLS